MKMKIIFCFVVGWLVVVFCGLVCMFACCLQGLRLRGCEIACHRHVGDGERKTKTGWILQADDFEERKK